MEKNIKESSQRIIFKHIMERNRNPTAAGKPFLEDQLMRKSAVSFIINVTQLGPPIGLPRALSDGFLMMKIWTEIISNNI
jgi:hypothetical protein